jgi:hypothetical protein
MKSHVGKFCKVLAGFGVAGLAVQGIVLGVGSGFAWMLGRSPSMRLALQGCAISWIAGWAGAGPIAWSLATNPLRVGTAVLGSTAVRFIVVLMLMAPALWLEQENRIALASWVAAGYLAVLVTDTWLAIGLMRRLSGNRN